jgi:hypothetical protein
LDADRLKVLISYSRADMAFADEQVAGLEYDGGVDISVDCNAVSEGEYWKALLGTLIADADTVVSILSPKLAGARSWPGSQGFIVRSMPTSTGGASTRSCSLSLTNGKPPTSRKTG